MGYEYQGKPVCSQSSYWTQFVINFVAVLGLLSLSIYSLFTGHWGVAIIAFLLMVPVGIYFRVVMMRRCRDIGWPPFLPWLFFGGGILGNMGRITAGSAAALRAGMLGLPLMIGLADFVFMIVIGCIASKRQDYAVVFEDDPRPGGFQPATRRGELTRSPAFSNAASAPTAAIPPAETEQEARWDSAIANALAAREAGESKPAPPQRPFAPGPLAGRPGGFGRRVV
ncbi:MAG: hypothetical protein WBL74_02975 [Novosphingobium sp.]|uniref:hypothetical protein n=1 Tax=Novosphingobium sp. TaxID=1874826 RepID=UPI003C7AE483